MNNKASRSNLFTEDKPPLLNLSDNRPHVDPTFRNFEHNNSPFINEMIMPLQIKNTNGKYTYDNDGNSYSIKDGYLVQNDTLSLFPVNNATFKRTNVTSLMSQYYAYDVDDGYEATVIYNSDHSFTITYKDFVVTTISLFIKGTILGSRLSIINGRAVFIVVYNDGNTNNIFTFISDGSTYTTQTGELVFKRTVPRRSSVYNWSGNTVDLVPDTLDPIITIAQLSDDILGYSVVNNYGEVLNTRYNGFATYFYSISNNTVKQLYKTIWPTTDTITEEVNTDYEIMFGLTNSLGRTSVAYNAVSADATNFYEYANGTIGSAITFPTGNTPADTGTYVDINGTQYSLYTYTKYKFTITFTCNSTATQSGIIWSFDIKAGNEVYTSDSDDTVTKVITIDIEQWPSEGTSFNVSDWWEGRIWDIYCNGESIEKVTVVGDTSTWTETLSWSTTETVTGISAAAYPNVVCDNGNLYAFYGFEQNTTAWSYVQSTGWRMVESGSLDTVDWNNNLYSVTSLESNTISSSAPILRNNSFVINQNLIQQTVRFCNSSCRVPSAGNDNSTSSRYDEYSNSNAYKLKYMTGTRSYSSFNYYGDYASNTPSSGYNEDFMIFKPIGMRVPVKPNSKFNLLYNTLSDGSCLIQSISWSSDEDHMGTLIAPWTSIDDDAYVIADSDYVIYRDKSNIWWKIEVVEETPEITALLDDRYILVNTTSYINMFDSKSNRKLHYATDYNNRLVYGTTDAQFWTGYTNSTVIRYVRYIADAINAAYQIQPKIAVGSSLLPYQVVVRPDVTSYELEHCLVDESTQGIDVYYSTITDTTCTYRFTLYPYVNPNKVTKFDLDNTYYAIAALSYLSPNMFTRYVNGAGNNDMAVETYDNYVLIYYNQQPYFLYTLNSQTASVTTSVINSSTDNPYESQAFFVLQGQFYSIIDDKIYVVSYSDGAIETMSAIVDIRGFKFIGNNPQIAFFWSPSLRAIYSFTGDAILQHIYDASKITGISGKYYYDETTQSIFIPTNEGLLIFGPKNTYMLEDFTNVTNVQFSNDSVTHITNNGVTYNVVYYPEDGYESNNVKLATSFYGLGDSESTSIDRWNITLFDQSKKSEPSYIKVKVITITDCVVQSEEKEFKIKPDMYDKWSNSVLIMYNPKYIKGQGVRLEVETPLTIQSIIPHVMDNKSGTLTRHGV